MNTPRRVAANRQNARRSTGPRSAQGKARAAQNAVTHGLLSQQALLHDEDPRALEALAEAVRAAWRPEGAQEHLQVELMILAVWRRRRLGLVEAGIFSWEQASILAARAGRRVKAYERVGLTAFPDDGGQAAITDPEGHQQAVADAEQLRARRHDPTATIGLTFIRAAGVFTTLSRYEAGIERSYYRALHELQRLQHARLGGHVPPPVALDVTISGRDDAGPDGLGTAPRPFDEAEPNGGAAAAENKGQSPAEEITRSTIEDELFE